MYTMNIQNDVIGLVLRENCKSKQMTDIIAWPSRCHGRIHPAQPTDAPSSQRSSRSHFYTLGFPRGWPLLRGLVPLGQRNLVPILPPAHLLGGGKRRRRVGWCPCSVICVNFLKKHTIPVFLLVEQRFYDNLIYKGFAIIPCQNRQEINSSQMVCFSRVLISA